MFIWGVGEFVCLCESFSSRQKPSLHVQSARWKTNSGKLCYSTLINMILKSPHILHIWYCVTFFREFIKFLQYLESQIRHRKKTYLYFGEGFTHKSKTISRQHIVIQTDVLRNKHKCINVNLPATFSGQRQILLGRKWNRKRKRGRAERTFWSDEFYTSWTVLRGLKIKYKLAWLLKSFITTA